jgi:Protein of unknown function (DUF2917)
MEHLGYETYLAHPELRERLEREARRARAEAARLFIFAPLARIAKRMLGRAALKAAPRFGIPPGGVAKLADGRGALVRVEAGKVWITQDGDRKDVFLRAGESFRIERDGLTLVSVLGNTAFAMVTVEPTGASL